MTGSYYVCGRKLRCGWYRCVYQHRYVHDLIVKVAKKDSCAKNENEYKVWQKYKDFPVSQLLCPCVEYVPGSYIVTKRCSPMPDWPAHVVQSYIEQFKNLGFSDVQREDLGVLSGRLVMVDYAIPNVKLEKFVSPVFVTLVE